VRRAVEVIAGRALVEVSGGVRLENVREYALPGVSVISVGSLTHSAAAVDLSLEFVRGRSV
jgi:nicotinate-nucleotide pyrophosphorylase (carboxylating)